MNFTIDYFVELTMNSTMSDPISGSKFIFTGKKNFLEYNGITNVSKRADPTDDTNIMRAFLDGTPCQAIRLGSVSGPGSKILNKIVKVSDDTRNNFTEILCSIKSKSVSVSRSFWLVYENPIGTCEFDFDYAINKICDVLRSCCEGCCNDKFERDLFYEMFPSGAYLSTSDSISKQNAAKLYSATNVVKKIDRLIDKCYTLGKELADYGNVSLSQQVCLSLKNTMDMIKKETELSHLKELENFKLE